MFPKRRDKYSLFQYKMALDREKLMYLGLMILNPECFSFVLLYYHLE